MTNYYFDDVKDNMDYITRLEHYYREGTAEDLIKLEQRIVEERFLCKEYNHSIIVKENGVDKRYDDVHIAICFCMATFTGCNVYTNFLNYVLEFSYDALASLMITSNVEISLGLKIIWILFKNIKPKFTKAILLSLSPVSLM